MSSQEALFVCGHALTPKHRFYFSSRSEDLMVFCFAFVDSLIFCSCRMACFERVSVFLTQENLLAQIRRHYTMQVKNNCLVNRKFLYCQLKHLHWR